MDNYIVNKISDGFWSIEDGGVRCFLIEGTQRALLVDTGYGTGDLASVVSSLTKKSLVLAVTHSDNDHIGGNKSFGAAHMHPSEFAHYWAGDCKGLPLAPLWEGDVIDLGGRRFEIILIPGHTPGSIALLDRGNRILIGGDSIQQGNTIFMFGAARNMPAYIASMERLAAKADLFDTVYASHGPREVKPSLLSELAQGAREVLAGEIEGSVPEATHRNYGKCMLYRAGNVSFWY